MPTEQTEADKRLARNRWLLLLLLLLLFLPCLLGDKSNSMIFDNSKIKRLVPDFACTVPFSRGAQEIVDWHLSDPARQVVDKELNGLMDRIIRAQESALPAS